MAPISDLYRMQAPMLTGLNQFQILNSIIKPVFILVMDLIAFWNFFPQMLFHHQTMFKTNVLFPIFFKVFLLIFGLISAVWFSAMTPKTCQRTINSFSTYQIHKMFFANKAFVFFLLIVAGIMSFARNAIARHRAVFFSSLGYNDFVTNFTFHGGMKYLIYLLPARRICNA